MPEWYTEARLPALTAAETHWLLSRGSLTVQLKALSAAVAPPPDGAAAFTVRVLAEGWRPLAADERAALERPAAADAPGWVREVQLCGPGGTPWVAARTVALATALAGAAAGGGPPVTLCSLGERPLGAVLFDRDSPFVRGPIAVTRMTEAALLQLHGDAGGEDGAHWTRRSLFRDDARGLSVLVAELFTPAFWSAVAQAEGGERL
uniref:Chorismate lyase n=1 Tax=Strigomonas culicis TaxID=28005 RepID=T1YT24_9TRYP|nr:chorismate lyase [Strigomonas culicis]